VVSVKMTTHVLSSIYGVFPRAALVIVREPEEYYGCSVLCAWRSGEPCAKS